MQPFALNQFASDLFKLAPDAIVVADSDGKYVAANQAAGELFNAPPDKLIGRAIAEFAPAEIQTADVFSRFLVGGAMRGEFTIVREDGTTRHVEYNARANVLPGYHVSILRDVTDRDRLVHSLRDSEEQFYRAFAANPVPMAIRTVDEGRYVAANEGFLQLTGYYRSELVGNTVRHLGLSTEEGAFERIQSLLRENGKIEGLEMKLRRKDRSVLDCLASFTVLDLGVGLRALITVTASTETKNTDGTVDNPSSHGVAGAVVETGAVAGDVPRESAWRSAREDGHTHP